MTKYSNLPLKIFIDTYTNILQNCSTDELRAILINMAEKVSTHDRQNFIDQLALSKPQNTKLPNIDLDILDEIEIIQSEMREQANEEPDWDNYNYDEDDSLYGYEDFVEPISDLFDQTEALFDYGHYEIAKKAYKELFNILEMEDDYGKGVRIYDLTDINPANCRAKYLCSIYLTEKKNKRAPILLDEMKKLAYFDHTRPKISDMITVFTKPLPAFHEFLTSWINTTKENREPSYDAWLREAILLRDGIVGLEKLASSEGNKRPRVYLDWMTALINKNEFKKALKVANIAFEKLSKNEPIRAAIADLISYCGQKTNNKKIMQDGLWLSFEAKPTLEKLITLYEQNTLPQQRQLMKQAAKIIEYHMKKSRDINYNQGWENDDIEDPSTPKASLLLHAFLFSGNENHALKLAKEGEALGWSSNNNSQPIFLTYNLVKATKLPLKKLPVNLNKLWHTSLENSLESRWCCKENNTKLLERLENIYQHILSSSPIIEDNTLDWCFLAAKERVSAIVSNTYRGAYERAALLTGACTETLKLINSEKAICYFNEIKNKFPRHSAFQAELKKLNLF